MVHNLPVRSSDGIMAASHSDVFHRRRCQHEWTKIGVLSSEHISLYVARTSLERVIVHSEVEFFLLGVGRFHADIRAGENWRSLEN
jgi:hypothetical protein